MILANPKSTGIGREDWPVRSATGAFTTIDVPGASYCCGINDAGQIVGTLHGADGRDHGFVTTP